MYPLNHHPQHPSDDQAFECLTLQKKFYSKNNHNFDLYGLSDDQKPYLAYLLLKTI